MNKILIIDDEKEICESMKMILEYEGYEANFSTSAIQGLKTLEDKSSRLFAIRYSNAGNERF